MNCRPGVISSAVCPQRADVGDRFLWTPTEGPSYAFGTELVPSEKRGRMARDDEPATQGWLSPLKHVGKS